jgi:transcriptional antiterminator RfaH
VIMGKIEAEAADEVWIVVQTKVGHERRTKEALERPRPGRPAFECYLPLMLREDKIYRRTYAAAFFPGYVFVKLDLTRGEWWAVYSTPGVLWVLGVDHPVGVKGTVIEGIRQREEAGFIKIAEAANLPDIKPNQVVTVTDGSPFAGLDCLFQEYVDGKRAVLLVSLFGRDSRLTVDWRKLRLKG